MPNRDFAISTLSCLVFVSLAMVLPFFVIYISFSAARARYFPKLFLNSVAVICMSKTSLDEKVLFYFLILLYSSGIKLSTIIVQHIILNRAVEQSKSVKVL